MLKAGFAPANAALTDSAISKLEFLNLQVQVFYLLVVKNDLFVLGIVEVDSELRRCTCAKVNAVEFDAVHQKISLIEVELHDLELRCGAYFHWRQWSQKLNLVLVSRAQRVNAASKRLVLEAIISLRLLVTGATSSINVIKP